MKLFLISASFRRLSVVVVDVVVVVVAVVGCGAVWLPPPSSAWTITKLRL